MTSKPLDSSHGRTTSGVAIHHRQWAAFTVKRRWAWHDITAFGQHTRSNNVVCDMPSPPLDNTLCKTTSSVACHHHCWAGHTVERHSACHDITSLGQYTRSNNVGRVMTSPTLDSTHGRQRRGCHDITALGRQTWSNNVRRDMTSPTLDSTHGRQRRAWHNVTALG